MTIDDVMEESPRKRSRNRTGASRDVAVNPKAKALLQERDAQIAALNHEVISLKNKISNIGKDSALTMQRSKRRQLTPYGTVVTEAVSSCGAKRRQLLSERSKMGRNASFATSKIIDALPDENTTQSSKFNLINRIVDMFKDPHSHVAYLKSEQFAKDLIKLNNKVRKVLEDEPRCVFLQSPAYVFGDIHGNLEDLHFFADNIWRLGMSLTAGNFVFLGDYVDRGKSCLECVAYLFAMKLMLPNKVFLLRGNHETRDVNGWEEHYGERSFIFQCRERFGDDLGFRIWDSTNTTFDRLPLAGVIDQDIFCVHGGIPRPITDSSVQGGRIKDILNVSKVAGINPPYEHEDDDYQQVASDCIWSDPASEDQEATSVDPHTGYGESLRGGGAICFGNLAVTNFLQQQGFSYIMRAHEAHADGVAVSKGARVFTVFSTSKDHNQGKTALAGCILIDFEKMQVINRSHAYKNLYVHRRDSTSLEMLSEAEIAERMQLGLVSSDLPEEPGYAESTEQEQEWEDFDDEEEADTSRDEVDSSFEDDEGYVLDERRKSSVDPVGTTASPPGGSHDNRVWCSEEDSEDSLPPKQIDFCGVDGSSRKKKNNKHRRFSSICEENEGDDEESTVDGEEAEEVV